ncbi:MAG TPA: hypothetical protein VKS25_14575 [Solirubrobacteraceae bacterium]|nr:hypothetical protein [Solirubrobacteraceae bacterium]
MNVGELLRETLELYRRNARIVLVSTVPIILIVTFLTALGLGELSAKFNPAPPPRDLYIDLLASELVTIPLISAILARWVYLRRRGEQTTIADLVAGALEVFPAVLLVVVAWFAVAVIGLVTLVIPGIFVAVSWYFVVQAVVIDGERGFAPITRSAAVVRGRWWQSLGTGIAVQLAAFIPQLILAYAFTPVARSANSYAIVVVAVALARVIAMPFVAIGGTLYYLQLRETALPRGRF